MKVTPHNPLNFKCFSLFLYLGSLGNLLLLLGDKVVQHEEVCEQSQQGNNVVKVGLGNIRRKRLTVIIEKIAGLQVHQNELRHLAKRQKALPPNLFVHVQGHEVIGVHNGMNQAVEDDCKVYVRIIPYVKV